MTDSTLVATPHEVIRWSIDTKADFDDVRTRYEAAVPVMDVARLAELRAQNAGWDAVLADAEASAPHGFMRFWSTDVGETMRLAGDSDACVTYLMGNHTIAERMYRHDPEVMLYAPLRTTIHRDREGRTRFSIDQPSTRFASFSVPEIAAVGVELDHKVANLFRVLGISVPDAFDRASAPHS
jgi:uncharacterized protein (DUF302 family)